jgi:NAD dependent epimerase/dehydratase family enzyme
VKIAITGASGLIGRALSASLTADGHDVIAVVRRPSSSDATSILWDPAAGSIEGEKFEGIDGVVHLAGAGIGDKRWSDSYKREILESRTKGTALLAETLAGLAQPPKVMVSGSAIGYYGDTGDTAVDETAPAGNDFLNTGDRSGDPRTVPPNRDRPHQRWRCVGEDAPTLPLWTWWPHGIGIAMVELDQHDR